MKFQTLPKVSVVYCLTLLSIVTSQAQSGASTKPSPIAAAAHTAVPTLIPYAGVAETQDARALAVEKSITFLIFKDEQGGEPLWVETQSVAIDAAGHYQVQLGASSPAGIPTTTFASGEGRWLEVQIPGQPTQPRILLASVPYAMKSADSETLGGLSAQAFVTQSQLASTAKDLAQKISPLITPFTTTSGTGTTNDIPLWTSSTALGNSVMSQSNGNISIGTTSAPAALTVAGNISNFANGTYSNFTSTAYNSVNYEGPRMAFDRYEGTLAAPAVVKPNDTVGWFDFFAYDGATADRVGQFSMFVDATPTSGVVPGRFEIETANSTGADTPRLTAYSNDNIVMATHGGKVGIGTGSPAATLEVNGTAKFDGLVTFATGQTFPGGISTGGVVNASSYDVNGSLFAYGGYNGDAFMGFAGNGNTGTGGSNTAVGTSSLPALTTGGSNSALGYASLYYNSSGNSNTAVGDVALEFNTSGSSNNALGAAALVRNTTGSHNTALGGTAMSNNTTGSENTAVGDTAGPDSASPALANTTAIGANATVSQSNSLVLGQTTAGSPGASFVSVGVGTATPVSEMEISNSALNALGPVLTLSNPAGTNTTTYSPASAAIDFKTYLHASTLHAPTSRIEASDENYGNELRFFVKQSGADSNGLLENFDIDSTEVYASPYLDVENFNQGITSNPSTVAEFGGTINVDATVYADTISASKKDFVVDHPTDPANKLLYHASVESSELMNIYTGNVVTDKFGLAIVQLPDWFQAENGDFRYQLTTIGRDAHAWVAEEVANNQFKIATNATFVKVSWQITALRQDAYAKAYPLVVEEAKSASQRGHYLHPELFGHAADARMQWGTHPRNSRRVAAAAAAHNNLAIPSSEPQK